MRNQILEDLKTAMKNQDKERLSVIRMVKGAIQMSELNKKHELSDEEVIIHDWRVFLGKCEKYLGKKVGRLFARIVYLFRPKKRNILKNADARKE